MRKKSVHNFSAEVLAVFLDGKGKKKIINALSEDIYPIERFKDAWNDSKNYLYKSVLDYL